MGCPENELVVVMKQQIFSKIEYGVPYWGPMISKVESDNLERILKITLEHIHLLV